MSASKTNAARRCTSHVTTRLTGVLGARYVVCGETYVLLRASAHLVVLVSRSRPCAALVFTAPRRPNPAYWRNYP